MSQKSYLQAYLREAIGRSNQVFRGESNEQIARKLMICNLFRKDDEWKTILRRRCNEASIEKQIRFLETLEKLPADDKDVWWGLVGMLQNRGTIDPNTGLYVPTVPAPKKSRVPFVEALHFGQQLAVIGEQAPGCPHLARQALPLFISLVSSQPALHRVMLSNAFLVETGVNANIATTHLLDHSNAVLEALKTDPEARVAAIDEAMELLELAVYDEKAIGIPLIKPVSEKVEKTLLVQQVVGCHAEVQRLFRNADTERLASETLSSVASRVKGDAFSEMRLAERQKSWLEAELDVVGALIKDLNAAQMDDEERLKKMRKVVEDTRDSWARLCESANSKALYQNQHGDVMDMPHQDLQIMNEEQLIRLRNEFQTRNDILRRFQRTGQ